MAAEKDEFVDLYAVLALSEDAKAEDIRKEINKLYLDAQQNLDHRNAKKRFAYQKMYEIYLPQARHLLLDRRRRAEYDRYLEAWRTGRSIEDVVESNPVPDMPDTGPETEEPPLPGMAAVEVDPELIAAEREEMWAKWKTGLATVSQGAGESDPASGAAASQSTEEGPPLQPAQQQQQATVQSQADALRQPVTPDQRTGNAQLPRPGARPAPPVPRSVAAAEAARRAGAARPGSIQSVRGANQGAGQHSSHEASHASEMERQREQQRYTLIKSAVQTAGLMWGGIWGGGIFLVGCVLLFVADSLKHYPLGMTRTVFAGICFLIVMAASIGGGIYGFRRAKRRAVGELSLLSVEDLMRRSR